MVDRNDRKDRINIGIIGTGRIVCEGHIPAIIQKSTMCDLTAVCNLRNIEKGESIAKKYGCNYYNNYIAMLEDEMLDLVVIATYAYTHSEIIKECIKRGIHVLVEKPFVLNYTDGMHICEMARKFDVKIFTSFQRRFNKYFRVIKKMVCDGSFGDIIFCECNNIHYRTDEYYAQKKSGQYDGGGVIINQAVHSLDMLCALFGEVEVIEKDLKCIGHNFAFEDWAKIEMMSGKTWIHFFATTCADKEHGYEVNIWGTKGYARLRNNYIEYGYQDKHGEYISECLEYYFSNEMLLRDEYEEIYKELVLAEYISSDLCRYESGLLSIVLTEKIYEENDNTN